MSQFCKYLKAINSGSLEDIKLINIEPYNMTYSRYRLCMQSAIKILNYQIIEYIYKTYNYNIGFHDCADAISTNNTIIISRILSKIPSETPLYSIDIDIILQLSNNQQDNRGMKTFIIYMIVCKNIKFKDIWNHVYKRKYNNIMNILLEIRNIQYYFKFLLIKLRKRRLSKALLYQKEYIGNKYEIYKLVSMYLI